MKHLKDIATPQLEVVCYTTATQDDRATLADVIPVVLIPRIHRQSRRMQRRAAQREHMQSMKLWDER